MTTAAAKPVEVEYPSGDGQPMGETWFHVQAIMWLHQALEDAFASRPDVFIASDMFCYYEQGNSRAVVAPDVMVVPGVGNHPRRSFFTWEEGNTVPAIVFEMASRSTWRDDLEDKYDRYESLGVREYFIFDPEGLYLIPTLQGFRLNRSVYRRLRATGEELSSELGFRMRGEGGMLRLLDADHRPILTRAERVEVAQQRAEEQQQRAEEAQQRAEEQQQRAEEQQQRAEEQQQRAEEQQQRADLLQGEVERLQALLQKYGRTNGNGS